MKQTRKALLLALLAGIVILSLVAIFNPLNNRVLDITLFATVLSCYNIIVTLMWCATYLNDTEK